MANTKWRAGDVARAADGSEGRVLIDDVSEDRVGYTHLPTGEQYAKDSFSFSCRYMTEEEYNHRQLELAREKLYRLEDEVWDAAGRVLFSGKWWGVCKPGAGHVILILLVGTKPKRGNNMAITILTPKNTDNAYWPGEFDVARRFEGRVIEVVKITEDRNHSDTLDYSDWRATQCTWALVWLGTHGVPGKRNAKGRLFAVLEEYSWNEPARDLEFHEQFAWVDCTNIFVGRGESKRQAEVDTVMGEGDPMMWTNYLAWKAHIAAIAAAEERAAQERAEQRAREAEKREANRPEVGKRMKVVRGRKVKPGTEGTVAYIRGTSVLLKGDDVWKDRAASGVWVDAAYLEARLSRVGRDWDDWGNLIVPVVV